MLDQPPLQVRVTQPSHDQVQPGGLQPLQLGGPAVQQLQQRARAPTGACAAQQQRRSSRKQEKGRHMQAQTAATRRAEFLAAWRLAVWRVEREKCFEVQLQVKKCSECCPVWR